MWTSGHRVSSRQAWVGSFLAALAPAASLPGQAARFGAWGWLGAVFATPVVLVVLWLIRSLGKEGLAADLTERWGWFGQGVRVVYYLWAVTLAALTAGGCVDRLGRTDYGEVPGWLAAALLAGVTAYLICRGWEAFLRAAQVFFLTLLAALGLFFALGAANLDGANLRPEGWEEVARGVGGIWPTLATLSVGALGMFIPRTPLQKGESLPRRWAVGWCLTAAGLCILVIGALGAELTAKAPLPFFLALQGLGFSGGFQRLEAMGTAVWVLSDLVLVGMAALVAAQVAEDRRGAWPVLIAAVLGGVCLPNGVVARAQGPLLAVNVVLGLVVPTLVAVSGGKDKRSSG